VSGDPLRPAKPRLYGDQLDPPACDCPLCRQKRADAQGSVVAPQGRPGE
jgi:hypothetical protein